MPVRAVWTRSRKHIHTVPTHCAQTPKRRGYLAQVTLWLCWGVGCGLSGWVVCVQGVWGCGDGCEEPSRVALSAGGVHALTRHSPPTPPHTPHNQTSVTNQVPAQPTVCKGCGGGVWGRGCGVSVWSGCEGWAHTVAELLRCICTVVRLQSVLAAFGGDRPSG